jgi:hypothetical protein
MAFRVADPQHDRITTRDPDMHLQIGPNGPRVPFEGPEDWAKFRLAPREWRTFRDMDPAAREIAERYRTLLHPGGVVELPLAVNAQGQVGYDPDWALLQCLDQDKIPITVFREIVATSDPCVTFPHAHGPGKGLPLAFAILASTRRPNDEKMRLLDCLPVEALRQPHQGQTLTAMAAKVLRRPVEELMLTDIALLVWVQTTTQQPLPVSARLEELTNPAQWEQVSRATQKHRYHGQSEEKRLSTMLCSKPLETALGSVMTVAKTSATSSKETRMKNYLRVYLECGVRACVAADLEPAPVASRRRYRA